MTKHIQESEKFLTELVDILDTTLKKGNKSVNIFASASKMQIVNNYVLLFFDSFLQTIDDYNLSKNDIRVMLRIMKMMSFGNLIRISWSDVAKSLNIAPNNMPRHLKKLKEAGLIIEDSNNMYLNPQIIAKGKFLHKKDDLNNELERLLNLGASILETTNREASILTPALIKKRNKKHNIADNQEPPF